MTHALAMLSGAMFATAALKTTGAESAWCLLVPLAIAIAMVALLQEKAR